MHSRASHKISTDALHLARFPVSSLHTNRPRLQPCQVTVACSTYALARATEERAALRARAEPQVDFECSIVAGTSHLHAVQGGASGFRQVLTGCFGKMRQHDDEVPDELISIWQA